MIGLVSRIESLLGRSHLYVLLSRRDPHGGAFGYTGTVSGYDICLSSKNRQKAYPEQELAHIPMELVYTNLMGPIAPAARAGHDHAATITDDCSRMKEILS